MAINGNNISVTADTSTWFNTTLWTYNLSQPAFGDEVIRAEVAGVPGSTVTFRFTGVPSIDTGEYRLSVDGDLLKRYRSGGAVSWSYADWSVHNFTVTYRKKPSPGDDGGSSGGSIPAPFCSAADGVADSHSWIAADTDRFTFDNVDSATGVRSIAVETHEPLSSFRLCIKALAERPNLTMLPANVYRFYEFTVDDSADQVTSTTVTFTVNRSFADQYDSVVLSRYDSEWIDLPTTRINGTGSVWTYEAMADGFSYFAVRGIDDGASGGSGETNESSVADDTSGNETDTPEESTTEDSGDSTSDGKSSSPGDETGSGSDGGFPLLPVIGVLFLLVVGGAAVGYWYRAQTKQITEDDVNRLYERIDQQVDETVVHQPNTDRTVDTDWLNKKLAQAEQLLRQDNHEEAYKLLKDVEQVLDDA